MRRLVVTVLAMLAVPAGAVAKGVEGVTVSPSPQGLQPGTPWIAHVRLLGAGTGGVVQPRLALRSASGRSISVRLRRSGRPGRYRARVVFPAAGRWTYGVRLAFRGSASAVLYRFPAVRIGGGARRVTKAVTVRVAHPVAR